MMFQVVFCLFFFFAANLILKGRKKDVLFTVYLHEQVKKRKIGKMKNLPGLAQMQYSGNTIFTGRVNSLRKDNCDMEYRVLF